MTELKTVDDLRPIYSHTPLFKNIELCSKQELKTEAVKRVNDCCPNDNVGGIPARKHSYCKACKRDIWFYGLTKKDLIQNKLEYVPSD